MRRFVRIGRSQLQKAATFRANRAYGVGKAGELVQPVIIFVMAESLEKKLDIRLRKMTGRTHERPDLRGRNRQWPLAQKCILQTGLHLSERAGHDVIDGEGMPAAIGQHRAVMVLEVCAHAGQIMHRFNAVFGQMMRRADA
jgi:hypothetical protein